MEYSFDVASAAADDIHLIRKLVRCCGADPELESHRLGHTPLTWATISGSVNALNGEGAVVDRKTSREGKQP